MKGDARHVCLLLQLQVTRACSGFLSLVILHLYILKSCSFIVKYVHFFLSLISSGLHHNNLLSHYQEKHLLSHSIPVRPEIFLLMNNKAVDRG